MPTEIFAFSKPYFRQFTPDPGKFEEVRCSLCGSVATVERNVLGPTQMAESMFGGKHLHDRFTCPVNDAEPDVSPFSTTLEGALHSRIYHLQEEMKKTASVSLKGLFLQEIEEL